MKRLLVFALLCIGPTVARAQALPDGSTLNFIRLLIHENNVAVPVQPSTPLVQQQYFNFAHCVCAEPGMATDPAYKQQTFAWLIQLMGVTNAAELQPLVGQVWVGSSCNADVLTRSEMCHQITSATIPSIGGIQATNGTQPEIPINDLMEPVCTTGQPCPQPCGQQVLAANEWVGVDTTMSGTPDYWVNQEIDTDSQPPPTPTSITANGSENGILLSWTTPPGNISDIAFYQALCSDQQGMPALSSPAKPPQYFTPRTLCGANVDANLAPCDFNDPSNPDTCTAPATTIPTDAGVDAPPDAPIAGAIPQANMDAGIPDASTGTPTDAPQPGLSQLQQLSSAFICGESDGATSTSLQISGLQNNVNYNVVLLVMDRSGNVAGVSINKPLTPKPVTDFWQDLHDKGSRVDGGFCLLAETYGDDNPLTNTLRRFRDHTLADTVLGRALIDAYYATLAKLGAVVHGHWALRILSGILLAPLVVFALLWHVLTLPGLIVVVALLALRRRIMKSRIAARAIAASAVGLVLVGAPARAHAQSPYWENQATGTTDESSGFAEEFSPAKWHVSVGVGPYTPQIDSQSTMRNSAGQGPYQAMFGGATVMPTLTVDRYLWRGYGDFGVGISLGYMGKTAHPYVIPSDPMDPDRPRSSGDTAAFRMFPLQVTAVYRFSVLDNDYGIPIVPYVRGGFGYYVWWSTIDGHIANDAAGFNSAIGASAGLVGTFGIAIRAERIDAAAARSMRESGIDHAGFYAEVNAGWVDGFSHATKLDVGDTTFFGGLEFEF